MSRPRFLADHNFHEGLLQGVLEKEPLVFLQRLRDVQMEETPDPEVLAYAATNGLILLSHDYKTMIAAAVNRINRGETMSGLIMAPQDFSDFGIIIEHLVLVWECMDAEEWHNRIEYLAG